MKYSIDITGMHCKGCSNFIKISLEDEGMENVDVEINTNSAVFESPVSDENKIKEILNKIFADLHGYSYTNIKKI